MITQVHTFPYQSNKIRIGCFKSTKLTYKKDKNNELPGKGCSFFLNKLTIKGGTYAFTTNTTSFTTCKRVGLCPKQNEDNSVRFKKKSKGKLWEVITYRTTRRKLNKEMD